MHDGTIVAQGSENKRYMADIMAAGPHAGHFTAKLTITNVAIEDQESENKLVVKNELGQTEYRFSLGLGEKPPVGELSNTLWATSQFGQVCLCRQLTSNSTL